MRLSYSFTGVCVGAILLLAVTYCSGPRQKKSEKRQTLGSIDVLQPELEKLVNADAKIEILGEGFSWSEGPVWIEEHNVVLFSDVPNNMVYQWAEGDSVKPYLRPSGFTGIPDGRKREGSNGLLRNPDGKLVLCQHGDRRVAVMSAALGSPSPVFETVVSHYKGARFNSPNDAAYHPNGDLYFTDPFYGLQDFEKDTEKEIRYQGVYRLKKGSTEPVLIDSTLKCPNGIAFSPDGNIMYVANSDPDSAIWKSYPVLEDGPVGDGEVFFDATELVKKGEPGLPDGLKVTRGGIILATGPGGVLVFNADGVHLGTIKTEVAAANCALNTEENALYITATNYLLRVPLSR
jgi:gluconolactonase